MNKFITFLFLGFFMSITNLLQAQVAINLSPASQTGANGDVVTIDVQATNFTNISGTQWTLTWDASELEFVDFTEFGLNGLDQGSFSIAPGEMIYTWDYFLVGGGNLATLADGDAVYKFRMRIVGSDPSSTIVFNNSGTVPTQVTDENFDEINTTTTGATVNNSDGMNTGGGPTQFSLVGGNVSSGQTICVDINVNNWDDIIGAQYGITWDPAVLQFSEVNNFGLPNLSADNFNADDALGELRFTWDAPNPGVEGTTLTDGSTIYSVCFIAISAAGTNSPINIEALTTLDLQLLELGNTDKDYEITSGTVNVTDGQATEVITVRASDEVGQNGETVCTKVTVENFNDVIALSYTMNWDASVMTYKEVTSFGLPSLSASQFENSAPGELRFLWNVDNGVTTDDGTLIYEVCFDIVGTAGASTDVSFGNSPIEIDAAGEPENGMLSPRTVRTFNGSVDVIGAGGFVVNVGEIAGEKGDTVCIPVVVNGFNDIGGFNWGMDWDPAVAKYVRTQNYGLNGLQASSISNTVPGFARTLWFDLGQNGFTLADGTVLYEICFEILGDEGTSTDVDIVPVSQTIPIDVSQIGTGSIPVTVLEGSVSSEAASASLTISNDNTNITDVLCFGESTGAIDLSVSGGVAPLTYAWSNSGGSTQDIATLAAGNYTVTVTDMEGSTATETFAVNQPASALSVGEGSTTNESAPSANDGAIDIVVSGGSTQYTFAWSNSATTEDLSGIAGGDYTVTVTDANGCSVISETITVTTNTATLTIDNGASTVTNVNCFGETNGAIDVTITGGTAPYTYAWNNGATTEDISGLAAGDYTLIVTDANSGTATQTFTVGQPNELTFSINNITNESTTNANDGSIDIMASGGTTPYTFAWSNAATSEDISGLGGDDYIVTITDANGCSLISTAITVGSSVPALVINSGSTIVTNVNCFGDATGAIDAVVSGGVAPLTFAWSNDATTEDISGLAAGDYTITVTDAASQSQSFTFSVSQPNSAIAINNPVVTDNSSCSGTPSGAIDITVAGGTAPYTFAWSNGSDAGDLNGLVEGDYSVTISDANGCSFIGGPYTVALSSDETPITIELTNVVDLSCNGEATGVVDITVLGGVQPYTFTWTNGGNPVNNLEDLSGVFAGTYDVVVSDANGCSATRQVEVIQPAPIFIGSNDITNESTSGANDGAIDITILGGTRPYTFAWSNDATTEDLSGIAGGVYTLVVTDANGCNMTEVVRVEIDNLSPIIITGDANNPCFGENNGSIDLSVSGGMSPYTYSWSNSAGNFPDLDDLSAGIYTVTVQDQAGQSATRTFTLNSPAAGITITGDVISDETGVRNDGSINLTVAGGTAPYTYAWSNGATTEDITGLAEGFYRVTITDASGCVFVSNDYEIEFTAFPILIRNVDVTPTSCAGEDDGKIEVTIAGGLPSFTFTWSDGTIDVLNQASPTAVLDDLAAGDYEYTITDNSGQAVDGIIEVTAPDAISIDNFDAAPPTSAGNDGAINIDVSGGTAPYTYSWSNGATSQDISGLSGGSYTVVITDANGCVLTSQQFDLVTGLGLAMSGIVDESCSGSRNGAIDITPFGGTAPYTFTWSNDANTEDLRNIPAGTYAVTVTDAAGGEFPLTGLVVEVASSLTVNSAIVTSIYNGGFNVSGNEKADGSAVVTVTGGTPPYNYNWSVGNPQSDGSRATGLPQGTHSVTVTDNSGCSQIVEVTLTAPAALTASMEVINSIDCSGECTGRARAVAAGGVGPYVYRWDAPDTFDELAMNLCAGTYTVTITDANSVDYIGVFDFEEPAALSLETSAIAPTDINAIDGSISVDVTGGTAPYNFIWNDPDGCVDANCNNIPFLRDSVFVIVTDANGCAQIASVAVPTPPDDCYLGRPVITPNDDGFNDQFIITCIDGVDNTLQIFNRWGQKIFEMENYDNSWNGTNRRGDVLPEGPYYYVLNVNGETAPIKGSFSLLKEF